MSSPKRVAILYPGDREARRTATPQSGRLPTVFAAFEALGVQAEPAVYHDDFRDEVKQQLLGISDDALPALWDCDFFFGPKDADGSDTYVLCEINVSCVSPFPESAAAPLAKAVLERI